MKTLIILSLALISLSAFSAEIGEDHKGQCIYANQTNKREAKEVSSPATSSTYNEGSTYSGGVSK